MLHPGEEGDGGKVKFCMKQILIILLFTSVAYSQSGVFVQYDSIETHRLKGYFTNDGRLVGWLNDYAISWNSNEWGMPLVYGHGLWIFGIRNDTLMGAVSMFSQNYTPGPIIGGQAAAIVAPEDSSLYRSYKLTSSSGPGDKDYDEWPVQWGAPVNPDGSPKLLGDVMLWTVYNDAHPDVHGWLETHKEVSTYNTNIEFRETIWGFNKSGYLGDALFFKWQIYNKGNAILDSVVICHWNDIDLMQTLANNSTFDLDRKFGYVYLNDDDYPDDYSLEYEWPVAASYFLLQGPIVPSTDLTAFAFDRVITNYRNLPTTAFWGIGDDGCMPDIFGGSPLTVRQAYNFARGKRHDGSNIINPITGDTTTFTFTGNPITGEGWLNDYCYGGMAGYMLSSGSFTMAPGDSQEVIFALVGASGDSLAEAVDNLFTKVDKIRHYANVTLDIEKKTDLMPMGFTLKQPFPNPFNPTTTVEFSIPQSGVISLDVYDVLGRQVDSILNKYRNVGHHKVQWNASNVPSGIYFIKMQSGDYSQVKKVMLLK